MNLYSAKNPKHQSCSTYIPLQIALKIVNHRLIQLVTLFSNIYILTISVINHKIKKLQKGTLAQWFLNRKKLHFEVYNEVHNYLSQNII